MEEMEKQRKLAALAKKYCLMPEKEPDPESVKQQEPAKKATPKVTKVTRQENELLLALMIIRNDLVKFSPAIRERCRDAGKWTWRDLRLMLTLIDRIQAAIWPTLTDRRQEYYDAYVRHGRYVMEIEKPVRPARYVLIRDTLLAALCEGVMENECLLCTREGKDVERCMIREALMEAAPPSKLRDAGSQWDDCEYREAARQLTRGEEVTV